MVSIGYVIDLIESRNAKKRIYLTSSLEVVRYIRIIYVGMYCNRLGVTILNVDSIADKEGYIVLHAHIHSILNGIQPYSTCIGIMRTVYGIVKA